VAMVKMTSLSGGVGPSLGNPEASLDPGICVTTLGGDPSVGVVGPQGLIPTIHYHPSHGGIGGVAYPAHRYVNPHFSTSGLPSGVMGMSSTSLPYSPLNPLTHHPHHLQLLPTSTQPPITTQKSAHHNHRPRQHTNI